MRIEIDIPKEFEEHFKQDKFKDSLERIMADIKHSLENGDCLCAGRYGYETIEMLEKALENSKTAYNIDKVVEELEEAKHEICLYDDDLECYQNGIDRAIEIVKQGVVSDSSDNVCEWKYTKEIMDNAEFKVGCNTNVLKRGVVPNNFSYHDFKYCPYCSKKIKVVK